jgi:hypothetical protein
MLIRSAANHASNDLKSNTRFGVTEFAYVCYIFINLYGYGLDGSQFEPRLRQAIFSSPHLSTLVLDYT